MSGTEFARAKESAADIMRQKQAACKSFPPLPPPAPFSVGQNLGGLGDDGEHSLV
ncbi:hypothetical protein GQ607_001932 [Colletotrichum asianum]|uniref:Uncharacterized protein n=1 Tax=Colletotrichum asianum TaxID=702518 RepID=A0A8H3WS52_9PEZI|nr:hypothetical protein GQ607_001932 [Colletotrichum asianum]